MIYRAYVLHPSTQRVEDKTTTYYPGVAEQAFRLILRRGAARLYSPGAVAILNARRGPEGRDIMRLEAVELDGPVDPAMTIHLHPPGERIRLAVPSSLGWPVVGRDAATGDIQLAPGALDTIEAANGLLPHTLTEDVIGDLLLSWYISRRRMGLPECPVMRQLISEVAEEDGLPEIKILPDTRPGRN